jgi:ABC-type multidrug transport system ATPase subunit
MRLLEVEDIAPRPLASLSGGQQQRLLLAGALAAEPQLLVLDEPTEGLDVRSRRIFLRALRGAAADGLSTIMISHTIDDLIALCDEVAWFHAAENPQSTSTVEMVAPAALAERVAAIHQTL